MYRKTAIALAVAAYWTMPAAEAAKFEVGESAELQIYGTIEPSITNETDANGDSSTEFTDNDSTIGAKGKYDFNETTSGFFKAEFEFDIDEAGDGISDTDEAFVGLKGGFGTIRFGTNDTLFEDEVGELLDEFENASPSEPRNNDEGNQITYFSPDFGGFSFGAEARFLGENEDENPTGSSETGFELTGRYDAENFGIVAGFSDGSTVVANNAFVDESTFGFGGYVEFGSIEVRGLYASEDEVGGGSTDRIGGLIGFNYGSGDVYFAVQDVSPDAGDSRTEIAAGVYHDIFKNLQIYLEAGTFDEVNDEGDIVEAGLIFKW